MILYLVRHGIAIDRTDPKAPAEAERPLTAKGVQKTRSAALGFLTLKSKPDLLVTSPFVRAAQTAEIFAEALGYAPEKIRVSDSLKPAADPAAFAKELASAKNKEVMCFGHAPHVDLFIAHLAGARAPFTELKKSGIACLEHSPHGHWQILWLLTPKVLRSLAE